MQLFSSVSSTTILEYKTRTHYNHLDKNFIMEKKDIFGAVAQKFMCMCVITDQNSCLTLWLTFLKYFRKKVMEMWVIFPQADDFGIFINIGSHIMERVRQKSRRFRLVKDDGGVCTYGVKVQLFWEGHKNFAHLPHFVWHHLVESNQGSTYESLKIRGGQY